MLVGTMIISGKRRQRFMALLAGVTFAFGAAAPVSADPDNPFGGLNCSCPHPVLGQHGPDAQQIVQGIQEGLAAQRAPQLQTDGRFATGSMAGHENPYS
ncbi:hypothetical protein U8D42_06385 [Mycobacterium europaeum]|uniref:hypothetical protein n=1 Tax=Mycobacterium europaeum TaxID=761804 RepID=UPI002ADFF054|nr:hypothetical protein [Mycobacterium europaeum]MEA1162320.1 hypothetical protein [Mycobacterium europaeum]